jgi:hypothetical protein
MPHFAHLSDPDLARLLGYARTHFGNHAGEVGPALIRRVRAAHH